MAQTESRIRLVFDGQEKGVTAAAAKSGAAVRKLADDVDKVGRSTDQFTAKTQALATRIGSVGKVAGLFGSAVGAGGAAVGAALPVIGSLGMQVGIATAAFKGSEKALEAYSKAVEEGTGDFSEYEKLLAEMTPEQREFTKAVVATKKPLSDLQKTAGRSFLPGVTKFLNDSVGLFPILDRNVERTGRIMSDTASQMGDLFKTDEFKRDLDGFLRATEPVTDAIGDSVVRLTGRLVKFGAEMAPAGEGFATFIRDLEAGIDGFLDGLAPHAADFKSIWESVGSILRDVLPIVGELAGHLAKELAPVLRDVAGWVRENKDEISDWVPTIAQAVAVLAGFAVASKVAGWLAGPIGALRTLSQLARIAGADVDDLGRKMDGAGRKGGITWGKGFVGGVSLAAAGVGATILLDKLIPKDVSSHGSQAARDMLGGMAATFTGEGASTFQALDVAKWISNPVMLGVEVGKRELMKLFGFTPPPLKVTADAAPAYETVGGWTRAAEGTVGAAKLNANPAGANSAVGAWRGLADGTSATAKLLANSSAGTAVVNTWRNLANAASGTAKLLANSSAGNAVVSGWRSFADRTSATARLLVNTSAASSALQSWRNTWSNFPVTVRAVMQRIGFAAGGPVLAPMGYATGGPVRGPGGPTSDRVPAMLSAGEHVLTADDVKRAGGHGAIMQLRDMLADRSAMTSSARAAVRPAPAPTGGSSGGAIQIHFSGNTSDALAATFMQMVRTGKIQLKAA